MVDVKQALRKITWGSLRSIVLRSLLYFVLCAVVFGFERIGFLPMNNLIAIIGGVFLSFIFLNIGGLWGMLPAGNFSFLVFLHFSLQSHVSQEVMVTSLILLNSLMLMVGIIGRQHLALQIELQHERSLTEGFVRTLVRTIDARDPYTANHSYRVALYALHLAALSGVKEAHLRDVWLAGLLHDIGKMGIPEAILLKEGRLTAEEYEAIKQHTILGYSFLKELSLPSDAVQIARHHHERMDGKGYPDGLSAAQIPTMAQIAAIADSFDAMTSNRSYRKGMDYTQALLEIERCAGSQFNPRLAQLWVSNVKPFESAVTLVRHIEHLYRSTIRDASHTELFMRSAESRNSLDISRRASATVIRLQHMLGAFIQDSPEAIAILDHQGIVMEINSSFERILGWSAEEVVRHRYPYLPTEGEPDNEVAWMLRRVVGGETIIGHTTHRLKKDGLRVWVQVSVFPLQDVERDVMAIGVILREITDAKELSKDVFLSRVGD